MAGVSAVIPAFNEQDKIGETVRALKNIPEINEIIVVDDGSTDDTAVTAINHGAMVVSMEINAGKSGAVYRGLRAARYDLIALVDADLGESSLEIKKLIRPLLKGEADMTVASFIEKNAGGGFGIVKKTAVFFLSKLTGHKVGSPLSGQRVLQRELLEEVSQFSRGFGLEFGLTAIGLLKGLRILEVETDMTHRVHGKSLKGFLHRGRQMLDILRMLVVILLFKKEVIR